MGYYVNIVESDVFIAKEDFENCYKAMCELNDHDEWKLGGGYNMDYNEKRISSTAPRPEGLNYHPAKWYSWMSPNYPELITNFQDLMAEIGFDVKYDDDGNVIRIWYDNKKGAEEVFLFAIAKWIKDGSYIIWTGEDNAYWKHSFSTGIMYEVEGEVTYSYNHAKIYQPLVYNGS